MTKKTSLASADHASMKLMMKTKTKQVNIPRSQTTFIVRLTKTRPSDHIIEYNWLHYIAALVQKEFDIALHNTPALLCILQNVLGLLSEDSTECDATVNKFRHLMEAPSDVQVTNELVSLAKLLDDDKYIATAERLMTEGIGFCPTKFSDDVYSEDFFTMAMLTMGSSGSGGK